MAGTARRKRGTPHDDFIRALLGDHEVAVAHLRAFLPRRIRTPIHLNSLELVRTRFVDPRLRAFETDFLLRFRIRRADRHAHLHYEQQSRPDPRMIYRSFHVLAQASDQIRSRSRDRISGCAPVVIAIVFYHGRRRWSAPTSLGLESRNGSSAEGFFGHLAPRIRYHLIDLARMSDTAILRRHRDGPAVAALAALIFKHGRAPDVVERLGHHPGLLRRAGRHPRWRKHFSILLHYLCRVNPSLSVSDLSDLLERRVNQEASTMPMSIYDKAIAKGRRLGRSEGRKEGREEGRESTLRETLLRLLRARFGGIPAARSRQITEADPEVLERWLETVVRARTLDRVFRSR